MDLNEVIEVKLNPPKSTSEFPFSFPFQPYEIQEEFMKYLFQALEEKKLGIFESPTGTGKSLSLLCGALTWLEEREVQRLKEVKIAADSYDLKKEEEEVNKSVDWIKLHLEFRKKRDYVGKAIREIKFIEEREKKREMILKKRKIKMKQWTIKERKKETLDKPAIKEDLEEFELFELYGENEYDSDSDHSEDEKEPEFHPYKIFFASRTHSQLSQFANEMKKTRFSSSVTAVSIGSRLNLCVNPQVSKLNNLSLINERCLDLQKSGKGKKTSETKKLKESNQCGCEYFQKEKISNLKDHILSQPMDIEDLVKAGQSSEFKACPYYAARKAASEAQLVLLPYNSILHEGTREGIKVNLKGSVLILDEAHNILDAISSMYSITLSLFQLSDASKGLSVYMNKFSNRFSSKNLLALKQVAFIIKALIKVLIKCADNSEQVFGIEEFKYHIEIEKFNLYDILKFIKKFKLMFKMRGYLKAFQEKGEGQKDTNIKGKSTTVSVEVKENEETKLRTGNGIMSFVEFLKSLTTLNSDGRILLDGKKEGKTIKFLLLSPAKHFSHLINETRSIILAGGTMKPYEEIEDQLFNLKGDRSRLMNFSCGHVMPRENLLCMAISSGPAARPFNFTFKNRNSQDQLKELGQCILNVSRMSPGGLVVFLPSYEYETVLFNFIKGSGMLEKLEAKKKVFRETREGHRTDILLAEYGREIGRGRGAILFAVVAGSLSEGINFSDELCRVVIVVSLPFPNAKSLEMKEKIKFISSHFGDVAGKAVCVNTCWRRINQSIGRSVRHGKDYAAILLIDERYSEENSLLPQWIKPTFIVPQSFGGVMGALGKFFATKK